MMKLNLGCGALKKDGYVNVDWHSLVEPDVVHDLNVFPYPFEDGTFDLVEAIHVLEHLDRPFRVMQEIHRLAKPGARIIVRVPHFSRGFTHAEHFHGFDVNFPLYFDHSFTKSGYVGVDFALGKTELHWLAFYHLLSDAGCGTVTISLLRVVDKILSFLANLSPQFCSRIWCHWVGGFDEIEFQLIRL